MMENSFLTYRDPDRRAPPSTEDFLDRKNVYISKLSNTHRKWSMEAASHAEHLPPPQRVKGQLT